MKPEDVTFIIRIQTVIAAVLALVVILAVSIPTVIGMQQGAAAVIPQVFVDWGGVIIGFYFGTFLTQVGGLLGKKPEPETPPVLPPAQPPAP